jgi:Protein of unknown function (DUF3379)
MIGADPQATSPQLEAHLAACEECRAWREQMLALNAKIRRAFELDLQKVQRMAPPNAGSFPFAAQNEAPPASPSRAGASNVTPFRRSGGIQAAGRAPRRVLPIAASLAAGLLIAFTLWLSRPAPSLAAEIVAHVEGEPDSWLQTQPVTAEKLAEVLHRSGVRLGAGMQPVMYASSCWFRGHFVPHFVVATGEGPVTVMILKNEHVTAPSQFNEDGYSGLLVPASAGSVAVLSRKPMELEPPAQTVVRALEAARN